MDRYSNSFGLDLLDTLWIGQGIRELDHRGRMLSCR